MSNELRGLDDLIGLRRVSDVPPPLLGGQSSRSAPPAGSRASRPARSARRTTVRGPDVHPLDAATAPGPALAPDRAVGVTSPVRPLLAAVSAPTGRRGTEPVTPVVTIIAWLVLLLAAGNAYLMLRTGGWVGTDLPFADQVDYRPAATGLMTWAGHPGWPTWLSVLGATGLAVAAATTRGLRQVRGAAGTTLFVSLILAIAGVAGSLAALLLIALATAIGVTVVVVLGVLFMAALVMLLIGLASG